MHIPIICAFLLHHVPLRMGSASLGNGMETPPFQSSIFMFVLLGKIFLYTFISVDIPQ